MGYLYQPKLKRDGTGRIYWQVAEARQRRLPPERAEPRRIRATGAALLLAVLVSGGCGPVLVGGGSADRLRTDFDVCKKETFWFALIPDFGTTSYFMEKECMNGLGWERAHGKLMGWYWVGRAETPTMLLARFADGTEQVLTLCPEQMTCQRVKLVPKVTEGDGIAWGYQARPHDSRQVDILIVGGRERCEGLRQRDAANGLKVSGDCEGPRYFKVER